ncbi:MAG: VCBS repeat-containing protein, partial [Verrucomicrobia bacterium]|nr:VCBS repeat-containing protein [Verrucomicrobiota bacterium]
MYAKSALFRSGILGATLVVFLLSTTQARDCNGNGVEDLLDISGGASLDCNANQIPDGCEGWPMRFRASNEMALNKTPKDLAACDLDNDGDLDLLVGQQSGGSSLRGLLNMGGRNFEAAWEKSVSGSLYALATADFNGDGSVDVVTANDTAMIILINQGDGSMGNAASYAVPAPTRSVHCADLDGDGAPDVVTTNRSQNSVSVWINANDGSGKLESPMKLELRTGGGTAANPVAVRTADLDRDGDLDIVAANEGTKDFSVLRSRGGGNFDPPATYPHGLTGTDPFSLQVADLNGDGSLDIAAATGRSLIFSFNHGDGTFAAAVIESTQAFSSAIKLLAHGDFNRDGDPDLATWSTRPKELLVKPNDRTGNFGVTTEIGLELTTVALAVGDFDGDGWEDLAAVSSTP